MTRFARAQVDVAAHRPDVALKECSRILMTDSFLALRAFHRAQAARSRTLENESRTTLACALLIGLDGLVEIAEDAPACREGVAGLHDCALRGATAAHVALAWVSLYPDKSPGEVALAALFADIGELMLWHYAPEVCQQVHAKKRADGQPWSAQDQTNVLGFSLRGLSIALAQAWRLPPTLIHLMRNMGSLRAQIVHLALTTSRQLERLADDPKIVADLASLSELLGVRASTILSPLPVSPTCRALLLERMGAGVESFANEAAA